MNFTPLPATHSGVHIFSVDVEDYFQVSAFESVVDRLQWDTFPSRVERNTGVLLDLMARYGAKGTFFTLGWVAHRFPSLVRRIADAGHEIASHGYWHRRIPTLSQGEFRQDIRDAKAALEAAAGRPVLGFRAPSFSILPGLEWAFDLLLEEGYRYDSSLFPIWRPGYGYPGAPLVPHRITRPSGTLLELPLAVTTVLGLRVPAAGGGYLRQLPYRVIRGAFRTWGQRGYSASFYIHPWEIDPDQPRLPVGWVTRRRHYGGLRRTLPRLERLFAEFQFGSIAEQFPELAGTTSPPQTAGDTVR